MQLHKLWKQDNKLIIVNNNWHELIINEYLNKSNQNLVHYLSCQAVRRTAYLNFCGNRMLKGLGLGTMALALALASKVQALALALRFWPWLHHWSAPQWLIPPVEQTSVMPITVTCLSHKPGHCSQCSADEASVLLLQLFGTVFLFICAHHPSVENNSKLSWKPISSNHAYASLWECFVLRLNLLTYLLLVGGLA